MLKKLIAALILPLPATVLMLVAALCWPRRRTLLLVLATLLLAVAGSPWFGHSLLRPFEAAHPPLAAGPANIRHIIVLSGGSSQEAWRAVADRLDEASLRRTLEGIRLLQQHPQATLVLSGGALYGPAPALAMAEFARLQGVPEHRLELETASTDTHDQAVALAPLAAQAPSILVTSAAHMPRALGMFRAAGADPLPAPTHFRTTDRPDAPWHYWWLPNSRGLALTTRAAYATLGITWSRLRGQWQAAAPG